jgi:signal transduction histidine kinase
MSTVRRPLLKRMPSRAWLALAWCVAIAYTLGTPLKRLQLLAEGSPLAAAAGGLSSIGWPLAAKAGVLALSAGLLRRKPLLALALLLAGSAAAAAAWNSGQIGILPILPAGIEVCFIAATRPLRSSVTALGMALGALLGSMIISAPALSRAAAWPALALGLAVIVAWLIGFAIRQQRAHRESLLAQAAIQAVTTERLRIARELHDMVAHSIGIIAIQAGAGSRVIDTQPSEARNALAAIEATSRETLAGLRRMLGILRQAEPDPAAGRSPLDQMPGLADIGRLAETTADAGLRLDIHSHGEQRLLPSEVDRSAFRIIQEAVTNVARHAGTDSCQVIIDWAPDELSIEILDDGRGCAAETPVSGYGLAGMRERTSLLHGHFTAGTRPEGGYRVTARLPAPASSR